MSSLERLYLLLMASHNYWCCNSDCVPELRHVHRLSIPHWLWCCYRLSRLSNFDHRARFPHSPSWSHFALQLFLVSRLHHCRMVHLRNLPNPQYLGVANSFSPSSFGPGHPTHFHLVHPRITPLVDRPRPRRGSHPCHSKASLRGER